MATEPVQGEAEETLADLVELVSDAKARAAIVGTYRNIEAGLGSFDAKLKAVCDAKGNLVDTPENRTLVGEIIKRSLKSEKMAGETFALIWRPWKLLGDSQRDLWKALAERSRGVAKYAQGLVDHLLRAEAARREAEEEAAREAVRAAQRAQADAEARALAAATADEAKEAEQAAEMAWQQTRQAVMTLDQAPATTSVKVGPATVYQSKRLDFEILDMGAFATAHPDLVEVRRGATLDALREATRGMPTLPETLAGWPGVKLKLSKGTSSR